MGVGFVVFAIYYIGLIGGESLANKGIVSPFWAMWIDNIFFLIVGIILITQMGNENTTQRGGQFAERVDAVRAWFQQRRGARA
jgi:lipopolysaccharide export system permease protein